MGVYKGDFTYWWIAESMMAVTFVAELSCWPASYIVATETSSSHLRAKSCGISWTTNLSWTGVFTIVLPYVYNLGKDSSDWGRQACLVLAAYCVNSCVSAWVYVAESNNRSPMEVDQLFAWRLSTRSFKNFEVESRYVRPVTTQWAVILEQTKRIKSRSAPCGEDILYIDHQHDFFISRCIGARLRSLMVEICLYV